jgi:hypothetical protein
LIPKSDAAAATDLQPVRASTDLNAQDSAVVGGDGPGDELEQQPVKAASGPRTPANPSVANVSLTPRCSSLKALTREAGWFTLPEDSGRTRSRVSVLSITPNTRQWFTEEHRLDAVEGPIEVHRIGEVDVSDVEPARSVPAQADGPSCRQGRSC